MELTAVGRCRGGPQQMMNAHYAQIVGTKRDYKNNLFNGEMDYEKEEQGLVEWCKTQLLPRMIRDGYLKAGKNCIITKCDFKSMEKFVDHFASCPYFVALDTCSDDGPSNYRLIVKFCVQDDRAFEIMSVGRQFNNEVKMYKEVLQIFRDLLSESRGELRGLVEELIPECRYCFFDEGNPKRSVLVFDDMNALGYRTAESKVYLDFEHCSAALRHLGRFHAVSLALKIRHPEVMDSVKSKFIECRYFDSPVVIENCEVFHHKCNQRGIDYFLSLGESPVPKGYVERFRDLISEPYSFIRKMIKPEEPLALICHGDFCRNNMLFKYDGGRVTDMKIFDFQTWRYGPPSIDLSFFIYLNTTQDMREKHFDELFMIYYDSLVSTTSDILDLTIGDVKDRYPFELFADDFARHAAYAYFHVAFFQSVMSEKIEVNWDETPEERARQLYSLGGEEVTKSIADVILDFYNREFYM